MKNEKYPISRRNFLKVSAATTAAVSAMSFGGCNVEKVPAPMKRKFGNLNFDVTTIALGGQGSLQWTPEDPPFVDQPTKGHFYTDSNLT